MPSRPWMPLYVADYLADTSHLRAAEHGAYLLLIMHYWARGSLPDDEQQLAAIARASAEEWPKIRQAIAGFFHRGWRHKRIDYEIRKREIIASKRAVAGQKGGARTAQKYWNSEVVPKSSKRPSATITRERTFRQSTDPAREAAAPPQAASDEASKGLTASPELVALMNDPAHSRRGK